MKWLVVLLITAALVLAACETPIDASQELATEETPHVEEVVHNDTPAVPSTPVVESPPQQPPTPPPVQAPPPSTPAVEPAPSPSAAQTTQVAKIPPEQPSPSSGPTPSSDIAPSQTEASLTGPLSDAALKLLARADEKVKSYDFVYAPPPDNIARDKFLIKGNRMKIELFDRGWFTPETHMTAIYVDAKTKTAAGFCEDNRLTHCPDPDRRFPASYDEYATKTPYQWLKEISYGKLDEGEKLSDRFTKKILYIRSNVLYEQWLDEFSGLPLRVKITNATGAFIYEFRHLNINSVTDDVFVHQAS